MTPPIKWKWFGMPLHFICGTDCVFHLGTQVGKVVISTIGMYVPRSKGAFDFGNQEDVTYNRKFETLVFKTTPGKCTCGCGAPKLDFHEIDGSPANNPAEAQKNHMILCEKYAKKFK